MVACHSGESPAAGTALTIGSVFELASISYTEPFCGVASPGVGTPFSCFNCFLGLSRAEPGLVLRLSRSSPLADMVEDEMEEKRRGLGKLDTIGMGRLSAREDAGRKPAAVSRGGDAMRRG